MSDYKWWRAALQNPHSIGTPALPVSMNEPQPGYYRNSQKPPQPCAIWEQDGVLWALEGDRKVDAEDLWSWVCRNPISYDLYKSAVAGVPWPDEPPAPKTHNLPVDEVEALDMELSGEIEQAEAFLKAPIANQDDADKAAIWAKRLGELEKKLDGIRDERKRPHLEAGRKIDAEFKPKIERAADFKTRLKRHLDAWLRAQAEAERKRQQEAMAEAARIRREAEEAAERAAEAARAIEEADINQPLDLEAVAESTEAALEAERKAAELAQAEADAQKRSTAAGRTGAKVSLRSYKMAKITDFDALYAALKTHPDMISKAEELAQRAASKGFPLAGMEIVTEERAA